MNPFFWKQIDLSDQSEYIKIKTYLQKFELAYDDVDATYCLIDRENAEIVGTGSIKRNLIKCLAISASYQEQAISNIIVSRLLDTIYEQKYNEAFVLTKAVYNTNFNNLGFFTIYQNDQIAFLTSRGDLFQNYFARLCDLGKNHKYQHVGAIVMNCNPFTLGHQYLISTASKQCDWVYIIPVKADVSLFPYQDRLTMIKKGIQEFKNVEVLEGSDYLLSQNIFPSYFIKSDVEIIKQQTALDADLFLTHFATSLNITQRFVGTEPFSYTTNIYNETLKSLFFNSPCQLVEIPRIADATGLTITATKVREWLAKKQWDQIKQFVPASTFSFLQTDHVQQLVSNNLNKVKKDY